jgi:hypothetical protein
MFWLEFPGVNILLDTLVQLGFVLAVVLPLALVTVAVLELAAYLLRRLMRTGPGEKRDVSLGEAHRPQGVAGRKTQSVRHSVPAAHLQG